MASVSLIDRRRWLKAVGTAVAGSLLPARYLRAATPPTAPSETATDAQASSPPRNDERRYIHGFEVYSGF